MLSSSDTPLADSALRDVTLQSFKADVLEASREAVVLVGFWSARDAACKQLMAILEKFARGSKGAIRLARCDVAQNAPIVQQMGVQGVPSVYAFYQGRPVDAFSGLISEAQAKAWLDQILKTTGADGGQKMGLETAFAQAAEYLAQKDIATARAIYTDILSMEPENAKAYAGLVRCLIDEGSVPKAREALNAAPEAIAKDKALDSVRAAIELFEQAGAAAGDTETLLAAIAQNPADHQARFALAMAYHAVGQNEDAVNQLLEIVRRDRKWNDDGARKQLVKFFEAFGAEDPLTLSARRRLSSILYR